MLREKNTAESTVCRFTIGRVSVAEDKRRGSRGNRTERP